MSRPIVIGVTGGIGAGKSTVVEAFVRRGAVPFSADTAVHELYASDEVRAAVHERWGGAVMREDGSVDRAAVAAIVFNDEDERRWLESLLHPLVATSWERFVDEHSSTSTSPEFVVAEVPLLYEANLEGRYDAVVAITAPFDTRMERIEARGSGRSHPVQRAAAQLPDDEKLRRADFAYVNSGSLAALDQFAGSVLDQLRVQQPGSS